MTPDEWNLALTLCTAKQLQALDYWRHGYGYKRIGVILDITSDSARDRIVRGLLSIRRSSNPPPGGLPSSRGVRPPVEGAAHTHPPRP